MKILIDNPTLVYSPPVNEDTQKWGVYAIPKMWRNHTGELVIRFNGEQDTSMTQQIVPNLYFVSHDDGETWEQLENGETRVVLNFPPALAPVKAAVLPLVKKDGLPELAQKIMDDLKYDFNCQYEEKDSIGKRYRRQDAIGTPFCISVDHESLNDGCVTVRRRDTMEQTRVKIEDLKSIIDKEVNLNNLLRNL